MTGRPSDGRPVYLSRGTRRRSFMNSLVSRLIDTHTHTEATTDRLLYLTTEMIGDVDIPG